MIYISKRNDATRIGKYPQKSYCSTRKTSRVPYVITCGWKNYNYLILVMSWIVHIAKLASLIPIIFEILKQHERQLIHITTGTQQTFTKEGFM